MRFALGARGVGQSMAKCIWLTRHLVEKASERTFDSYLVVCEKTDRFVDIMNGSYEKGCSSIDSPNHPLLFELLDYVKFLCQWRDQSRSEKYNNLYFAESTHQDAVWSALLSLVYSARTQMPVGFNRVL